MIKSHIAIFIFLIALLIGCSPVPSNLVRTWDNKDLNNLTIDLISATKVEWMSFSTNGTVSVTAGERGGPLAGPLFCWKIDTDGSLLVGEKNGQICYKIRKIELTDTKLVAEVNGKQQTYKRLE